MKQFLLLFFGLLFGFGMFAQNITVKGTVTSNDDGQVLPGVTVFEKGSSNGTVTGANGTYQITVPGDATIVFSFIGMETLELAVNNRTEINVNLITEASDIEEVVVIGYGIQKKKDLTGSVSLVDDEVIKNTGSIKIEQALQGTITGVNVTNQSGSPGAGLDVRIRGISTNGDASPVVIVDGYISSLENLNPNDIESITVLKDAQAAIYGTVGANGIILVTTKKGKKNTPTRVNFNSSYGLQQTIRKLPLLNATEYAILLNESNAVSGQSVPFPDISQLGYGTDWQDVLFQTAPIINNDIFISGGSDRVIYTISASDLRQDGIIGGDKSGYRRNTARISMGADLYKWLNFNTSLTYSNLNRKSINDYGLGSVLFNALNMPPTLPVYDENGDYFLAPSNLGIEIINPLQQIANTFNDYNMNMLSGNFGLESSFADKFKAVARMGFNSSFDNNKSFYKIVDYGGKVFDVTRSSVYQANNNYNNYTFDAFVTYADEFLSYHQITFIIGTTIFKDWGEHLDATGYDVPYNSWEFADITLAPGVSETKSTGSWRYDQRRLSYFTRLQYDYLGKYLLSAMLRRDASTKFGPDNAVAYFPSVTAGWILSEEGFMSSFKNLDFLKIRASYGILGSDKIPPFQYISSLGGEATYVLDGALVQGSAVGVLPNPKVKWEQSEQIDAGFDLRLFKNRVEITADYYLKTTKDLLIVGIPVSGILGTNAPGAGSPTINAGTVRNSGIEFAIGFKGNIKKNVSYQLNYTITTIKNEVLQVDNGTDFYPGGSFGVGQALPARMEVGYPIGYYYGYVTDGIFQSQEEVDAHPSQLALGADACPGDIRFKDVNGDGAINTDDRSYIGNPIPDYVMGFNINIQFKGFDFLAYTYASIGNEIVRNYERTQANVNKLTFYMDRWTGPGTSDDVPRLTNSATANNVFSDFYVEDGSFIRLQNIQLGYTLPILLTSKAKIQKLRVYIGVNNLLTLTRYLGFDPAASSGQPIGSGFDAGFYPAAKIYSAGLNINF
jgi:TonB-linked SusC/RagA family outer membrane protein